MKCPKCNTEVNPLGIDGAGGYHPGKACRAAIAQQWAAIRGGAGPMAFADNGTMPLNTQFIRERRDALKLTQAEAADRAGFPNAQKWSNYENGRIPDPQLSSLEAIARALKCPVAKLIR